MSVCNYHLAYPSGENPSALELANPVTWMGDVLQSMTDLPVDPIPKIDEVEGLVQLIAGDAVPWDMDRIDDEDGLDQFHGVSGAKEVTSTSSTRACGRPSATSKGAPSPRSSRWVQSPLASQATLPAPLTRTAAVNSGIVVVIAAGNSNSDVCQFLPAFVYAALTVGFTISSDSMSSFSNFFR